MSQQPDDRTWEEEHIHNLNLDIDKLKSRLAGYRLLLTRAASAIGEAGYEDFDTGLLDAISDAESHIDFE